MLTVIGQFEAIRDGGEVGICHRWVAEGAANLGRLIPELTLMRSYWVV